MLDILIQNGVIVDGSGSTRYRADIGVEGKRIVQVDQLQGAEARTVIDATGYVVTPGFVDMHSHADFSLPINPTADSLVCQGITTAVIGQCGATPAEFSLAVLELDLAGKIELLSGGLIALSDPNG